MYLKLQCLYLFLQPGKIKLLNPENTSPSVILGSRKPIAIREDRQELPTSELETGRDVEPLRDSRVVREATTNTKQPSTTLMPGNQSVSSDIQESLKSLRKKVSTLVRGIQVLKTQAKNVMTTLEAISDTDEFESSEKPSEDINPFLLVMKKLKESQGIEPTESSSIVKETTGTGLDSSTESSDVSRLLRVIGGVKPEMYNDEPVKMYELPVDTEVLHASELLTQLHLLDKSYTTQPNILSEGKLASTFSVVGLNALPQTPLYC